MDGKTLVCSGAFLLLLGTTPAQFDDRRATVVIQGEVLTDRGLQQETGAGVIVGQDDGLQVVTAYHIADRKHLQLNELTAKWANGTTASNCTWSIPGNVVSNYTVSANDAEYALPNLSSNPTRFIGLNRFRPAHQV